MIPLHHSEPEPEPEPDSRTLGDAYRSLAHEQCGHPLTPYTVSPALAARLAKVTGYAVVDPTPTAGE